MPDPAPAPLPLILLGICRDTDGTYAVTDSTGTVHHAGDTVGLGRLVARLVDDPEIPRTVPDSHERNAVIDVAGRVARRLVPEKSPLFDMLEPLAHMVGNKIAKEAARPRVRNPSGSRRRRGQARSNRM